MAFGLDYAWGRISAAEHHAVGSTFACRYLSYDASKNLSRVEADALRRGGVTIVAVWETVAKRGQAGREGGRADAREALRQANACGIPKTRPIYFAPADYDAPEGDQPAINDYLRGCADVLGLARVGAYFGYGPGKRAMDAGLMRYFWQTYAWSGGNVDPRACLYQYSNDHVVAGVSCDYDRSLKADFGQWDFTAKPARTTPHKAAGHMRFAGSFNASTGRWEIHGVPSEDARWGSADREVKAQVTLALGGKRRGSWTIKRTGGTK